MEQCEKVVSKDTGKLVFPSFCDSQCKIKFNPDDKCANTNGGCIVTTPDGGELLINPAGSLIV